MGINPQTWGPNDEQAPRWAKEFLEWYCTPPDLRVIQTASALADSLGVPKSRLSELLRTAWFESRVKASKAYNGFSYGDLAMVKDVLLRKALAGDRESAIAVLKHSGDAPTSGEAAVVPAGSLSDEALAKELSERLTAPKALTEVVDTTAVDNTTKE